MKFLKDFFYIHHHERRALLVILTLLVGSTTMIFIVGSKETMPSEKQQAHNDSIIRHATRQQPGYYDEGLQSSEVFAFDPNTASQSDFQRLGLQANYMNAVSEVNNSQRNYKKQFDNYTMAQDVYNVTADQYKEGVASMTAVLQDEMRMSEAMKIGRAHV